MRMPTQVRNLGYSLILFVVFLALLELLVRGYFFAFNKTFPKARHLDDYFGWVTLGDVRVETTFEGYGTVVYSTKQHGFRVFGELDTKDPKLFVIGDSQTQARKVNDGETFFDYIGEHSDAQIFAYGGGGYGSLQEYLILDKYIDHIDPDVVLWQFCNNDLYNNLFELEANTTFNNRMTRPYLEDGEIVYRYPHASWLFRNVVRESYLLRFVGLRLDIFMATHFPATNRETQHYIPLFGQAFEVTSKILAMVRRRAGERPVLSFSACDHDSGRWADISRDNGIDYIAGVPDAVSAAKQSGLVVDGSPKDRHWNGVGHAIAGRVIVDDLVRRGLVRPVGDRGRDIAAEAAAEHSD